MSHSDPDSALAQRDFSIEKPLELFNAYVQDISASASYGADGSSCQITLVAPEGKGGTAKMTDDTTWLTKGISLDGPLKTFKPDFPPLGTAIGIVWEGFTFGGVLQRYTKKRSISGYTWDVIIESPAKILDGIQIITEGFQGTAYTGNYADQPWKENVFSTQLNNIWNPFALKENFEMGGIFGASNTNSVGWPAQHLIKMVQQIATGAGAAGTDLWAEKGRGVVHGDLNYDGVPDSVDFGLSRFTPLFGGKAVFGESEYLVDLNAILSIPYYPEHFRIKGPVQSLSSIIQEAVDIAVHDFIVGVYPCEEKNQKVATDHEPDWPGWFSNMMGHTKRIYSYQVEEKEIDPDTGEWTGQMITVTYNDESSIRGAKRIGYPIQYNEMLWHKNDGTTEAVLVSDLDYVPTIQIKVQDKTEQPTAGTVEEIVIDAEKSDKLIGADSGKEYNDAVTQKLVIGGPATRYWRAFGGTNDVAPLWGKSKTGYPIYYLGTDYSKNAPAPVVLNDGTIYDATILEIRCAGTGRETWEAYHIITAYFKGTTTNHFANFAINNRLWEQILNNNAVGPLGLIDTSSLTAAKIQAVQIKDRLDMIFSSIQSTANEFYGQQFMVRLPVEPGGQPNNIKWVAEDQEYITSWDMSDSSWTDELPFNDVTFYDSEGRTKTTAMWSIDPYNRTDYSSLGADYSLGGFSGDDGLPAFQGIASNQCQADKDILWIPGSMNTGNTNNDGETIFADVVTACVPVRCKPVLYHDSYSTVTDGFRMLVKLIGGVTIGNPNVAPPFWQSFGNKNIQFPLGPVHLIPDMFGLAQQSNRYNWGPWWKSSKPDGSATTGRAEVAFEANLKPETFGGWSGLDDAGWAYAHVGNAMLGGQESGYVELAEVPNYNLTDRFAGSGPYITSMDIKVNTDGITTTYKFNTWTRSFGKLAKYNVDRLARINKNALKFLQEQRNRFQKRPIPPLGFHGAAGKIAAMNAQKKRNAPGAGPMMGFFGGLAPGGAVGGP